MKIEALMKLDGLDLSDPNVKKQLRQLIQTRAMAEFPRALKRILEILDSESESRAMAAARLLAELGGLTVNKHEVEVKMTFNDLRRRPSEGQLAALFDIKSPPIEGQIEDE